MRTDFTPSVNLIRDFDREFNYVPTPNARRIFDQIVRDFKVGIHSFNIIGSYGTGKSAFLLAVEKSLKGDDSYFGPPNGQLNGLTKFSFLNLVGDYRSVIEAFAEHFDVKEGQSAKRSIFRKLDSYYQRVSNESGLLLIVIDEFGKFLEHAAEHNSAKELYFIQQLAEYAGDKNVMFITTLHQGFDSYSRNLYHTQQREWEKVKGRLKELTFNEPVEQLLYVAANCLGNKKSSSRASTIKELIQLIETSNTFPLKNDLSLELANSLVPLDLIAAAGLTLALQKYGQNERSLFTFLQSNDHLGIHDFDTQKEPFFNLSNVYDYLLHNYFSFISTRHNPHYIQWSAIKRAIERAEGSLDKNLIDALKLIKTIGLLNIFAKDSAKLDSVFLSGYARICLGIQSAKSVLKKLESLKIIRYVNFKSKFVLFEGTDLDIEVAISEAATRIEPITEMASSIREYFTFPCILAKAAYYKYGTPRFFEFVISDQLFKQAPRGEVDGVINLIFSDILTEKDIIEFSESAEEAILFGYYRNTERIKEILSQIEKVKYVIDSITDDRVAIRELNSILSNQVEELNNQVQKKLRSEDDDVIWVVGGRMIEVAGRSEFNSLLSEICDRVYHGTPTFSNELVNKHSLSSSIIFARKNLLHALLNNIEQEDLGFPKDRFPPEKTIYYTLLKKTGFHRESDGGYFLGPPQDASFQKLWRAGESFLNSARISRKSLDDFVTILSSRPFRLKRGFIEFWLPLFLLAKKDDFALFGEAGYIPIISAEVIELIIRKPKKFHIKTFEITGVRLDLFNKYRKLLSRTSETKLTNETFVDTISPFLAFYNRLPEYSQKTKRLSKSALALRDTIANSTDPEETFFVAFPRALGYTDLDLREKQDYLQDYIRQLHNCLNELRSCFDNLVDRIEAHFLKDLGYPNLDFQKYKQQLRNRYKSLRTHLLLPYQKTFHIRLNSELDERQAWVNSLVHALIGKSLENIRDEEEELVFEKFTSIFIELDNLCEISQIDFDGTKEQILKVEVTSFENGRSGHLLRIPKNHEHAKTLEAKLKSNLSTDKRKNIAILLKLLNQELSDE